MNRKRIQKWLISQTLTVAVLFFAVLPAAAVEPAARDIRPAVTGRAESENETDTKEKTESENEKNMSADTGTDTEDDAGADTEDDTGAGTENDAGTDTEDDTGAGTEDDAVTDTKDDTTADTEDDTGAGTEDDAVTDTEDDTTADTEDDTSADTGADTEDDAGTDTEDDAGADTEDDAVTDSEEVISSVHECSWSPAWNHDESCHWHECEAENCSVTDHNDKNGYAQHNYGEDNICTSCGYCSPDLLSSRTEAGVVPSFQEAYEAMAGLKDQYPEGMTWTNFEPYGSRGELGDSYTWKGGKVYGASRGVGCAAFAFILSDAAFGDLPARVIEIGNFTFEDVKVGDILRVNGGSHSVIVLQKSAGGVIIAEGNYNKTVHWGRALSEAEVLASSFIITRYPDGYIPPDAPDAGEVVKSGTEGGLNWALTKAGTLTISGSGAIPDYSADQLPPWNEPGVSTVIIENGVTGIGDYAFYQNSALNVYIPDGITTIGQSAFDGSGLISVTIPGTVESIKDKAFHACANLTSATVSEGIKTIGNEAFRGCTSLGYIDFPASITSVGAGAFMSCEKMTRIRFMPGSEKVELGDNLFSQCWQLKSVTLPQTADRISGGMFQSCSSLPALYIPASVKNIGDFPNNGASPFASCNALKYIYFEGAETEWKAMMNPFLIGSLTSTGTEVVCNAVFDNPFAPDPDDPGDFWPDDKDPDHSDGAHKHSWSESWSSDESCHWHECGTGCTITDNRDKDGYGSHSFGSWVTDVAATASQNGSRHRDCTVCGYRQNDNIPAYGSSDDSNNSNGGSNDNNGSNDSNDSSNGNGNGGSSNGNGNNGGTNGSNGNNGGTNGSSGGTNGNNSSNSNGGSSGSGNNSNPNESGGSSDNEPADTESEPSQNPEETGAAESDESEMQNTPDMETGAESVSGSDKGGNWTIIPILAVPVGGAAGLGYVFMRKRGWLKK